MSNDNVYIPSSALDSFAHALYADVIPEIGTRNPTLMVKLKLNKNKPQFSTIQFVVTHYIRGEEKYKTFEIDLKLMYAQAALQQMKLFASKPWDGEKDHVVWEVKAPKKVNGQMTKERITVGKLVVGRNEKGTFISVVHWNDKYPHIAFYAGNNDGMNVVNPAPEDTKRIYSYVNANALGWATTIDNLLTTEYSLGMRRILDNLERQKQQNGGGNNNSYGGGNSSSYGGGNNSNSSTTDSYSSSGEEFNF